jgi:hypothetical protein
MDNLPIHEGMPGQARGPNKPSTSRKPEVLRWRVGQYIKTPSKQKKPKPKPCPNLASTRSKPQLCPRCQHLHPITSTPISHPDPIKLLLNIGTTGLDPFRRKRPEDDIKVYQDIIHDSITFGWKNLIPIESSPGSGYYPWVATCYEFICTDDAHYYSNLYAGLMHMHVIRNGPHALRQLPRPVLEMKGKTLQCLQWEIDHLSDDGLGLARDSLLSTIYVMAGHEPNLAALDIPPLTYAASPMAGYQLLGSTGMMKTEHTHYSALYHLVAQRGGIHEIKTFGVGNQLATGDLVIATQALRPCGFACYWYPHTLTQMGVEPLTPRGEVLKSHFGFGFELLSTQKQMSIDPFLDLLPWLRDVTIAIDHFHHTNGQTPVVGKLIDCTNYIQYRLLALEHHDYTLRDTTSTAPGSGSGTVATVPKAAISALRTIQLAALIYTDLVVFPLSYASGHRYNLARELHAQLNALQGWFLDDPSLHIWVCSMAYIALLPYHIHTEMGKDLKFGIGEVLEGALREGGGGGGRGGGGDRGNELREGGDGGRGREGGGREGRKVQGRYERYLTLMKKWLWWDVVCDGYARDLWRDVGGGGSEWVLKGGT